MRAEIDRRAAATGNASYATMARMVGRLQQLEKEKLTLTVARHQALRAGSASAASAGQDRVGELLEDLNDLMVELKSLAADVDDAAGVIAAAAPEVA